MSTICSSSSTPLTGFNLRPLRRKLRRPSWVCARSDNSNNSQSSISSNENQQQLNLSVLRFTLGIPGLDESYLPRWLGYGFGSLIILNHLVGSDYVTPAQLRTEGLGLSLAAFSVALPYFGKFLKGSTITDQVSLPEDAKQVFVMSQSSSDHQKEDLAWATYVLLRNTNTISVIVSVRNELCVRGYWRTPEDVLKVDMLDWFNSQIRQIGLSDLKDVLYFPQVTGSELQKLLPKGIQSLLVQPIVGASSTADAGSVIEGFVLLASNLSYAYNEKDRAWIMAIANKFSIWRRMHELREAREHRPAKTH